MCQGTVVKPDLPVPMPGKVSDPRLAPNEVIMPHLSRPFRTAATRSADAGAHFGCPAVPKACDFPLPNLRMRAWFQPPRRISVAQNGRFVRCGTVTQRRRPSDPFAWRCNTRWVTAHLHRDRHRVLTTSWHRLSWRTGCTIWRSLPPCIPAGQRQ